MAVLALGGCGVGESIGGSSQTLRVALQGEPTSLNPVLGTPADARAFGGIFDTLVGYDPETMQPNEGGLLTSWEQTSPTEWTFQVRKGVTFHNGEVFDAEAAAFALAEWRDNPASILRNWFGVIGDIREVDGSLQVTTAGPYSAMPALLTSAYAVAPDFYAEVGPEEFSRRPVGTGPYQLDEYRSGQSLHVVGYADHWRGDPKLDGIEYSWSSEASSRHALLASGDVDLAIDLLPADVARLEGDDDFAVVSARTSYGLTLFLNSTRAPLDDVRLREAIAKSIDRDGLIRSVFQGKGAVASHALIGDLLATPVTVEVDRDLETAKALVARSGDKRVVFGYTAGRFPNDSIVGDAVTGMLQEAGFEVEQRAEEYGTYREQRDQGSFDIFMEEISPVFNHPDGLVKYLLGEEASRKTCVDGAAYDALSQQALAAESPVESSEAYARIEEKALAEDYCFVPLTKTVYSYGMTERVKEFQPSRKGYPDYWLIDLD